MTPRDSELIQLAKKVGIVASAALATITLTGMLWSWSFGRSQAVQDERIDRLVKVVELQAVIVVEPPGSAESARALADLRAMRSVVK